MTGFGKAAVEVNCKKITVEVKSLNSKQMDLSTRIPSALRSFEIEVRNLACRELERGKADLTVSLENLAGASTAVKLNTAALLQYKQQLRQASADLDIDIPDSEMFTLLMRFPDVIVSESDTDDSPDIQAALTKAVSQALDALRSHRRAEGERLEAFFAERISGITDLLAQVEPFEAERLERIRTRIEEGLARIPVAEIDKGRLEQEMIFYIEKLDVNEERQRLSQHLRYFTETMAGPAGQGKKLGFIAQEMGREINTLGSKSNHSEMQRIVVKMKDILEQIKEQVLNVL